MFRSIVVPLDLEEQGDRALPLAGRLAAAAGVPLELVTVSSPNLPEECDRYELDERAALLPGVTAHSTVLHGDDPAEALLAWLDAHPGALPVMATHARGLLTQRLFGSVSEGLLARYRGPIVLVGPHVEVQRGPGAPAVVIVSAHDEAVAAAARAWTATFAPPAVAPVAQPRPSRAAPVTGTADELGDVVVAIASRRWRDPDHRHLASVARSVTQASRHPVLVVPAAS